MRSQTDLSPLQLQIVMCLANGMKLDEIAKLIDRSRSYVAKNADQARFKMNARTLPQLVSIVIASGQLEWASGERVMNGAVKSS